MQSSGIMNIFDVVVRYLGDGMSDDKEIRQLRRKVRLLTQAVDELRTRLDEIEQRATGVPRGEDESCPVAMPEAQSALDTAEQLSADIVDIGEELPSVDSPEAQSSPTPIEQQPAETVDTGEELPSEVLPEAQSSPTPVEPQPAETADTGEEVPSVDSPETPAPMPVEQPPADIEDDAEEELQRVASTTVRPIQREPARVVERKPPFSSLPLANYVRNWIKERREKVAEQGWELSLGTYWLPRIAVVCIAIAVVFFLSLAIKRYGAKYLPYERIGVGYAVCAGLLLFAWRFEKRYQELARVLYGGGFAVMYFVTFATHYISYSRIIPRPEPALLLLAAVVVGWAVVGQLRRSRVIGVMATFLGHLTILISTLSLEAPSPLWAPGILFLSAGAAFFLLWNSWYYIGFLGFAGTYLNIAVFLHRGHMGHDSPEFLGVMGVLAAVYVGCTVAELAAPERLRRGEIPAWCAMPLSA